MDEVAKYISATVTSAVEGKVNFKDAADGLTSLLYKTKPSAAQVKDLVNLVFTQGTSAIVKGDKDKIVVLLMQNLTIALFDYETLAKQQQQSSSAVAASSSSSKSAHDAVNEALFFPSEDNLKTMIAYLKSAQSTLDICVFTITDDRIANAILTAKKNGAKVRIISDNEKAEDQGSDIDKLADSGIPTCVDDSPFHMHNKFAIIDNTYLINGSFNWTRSASTSNNENIIITSNGELIKKFNYEFNKLWAKFYKG